jgi:hypothetical protein
MAVSYDFLRTAIALSAAGNPHSLTARGRVMFDVLLMAGAVARSCHPRSVTSCAPAVTASSKSLLGEGIIRLADTVSYQNGFGAYQDVRVTCVLDIASRTAYVEMM